MNKRRHKDSARDLYMYTLREWQKQVFDVQDLIFCASRTDGSDGWTPFPVGASHLTFPFILKHKGFLKTDHTQMFHASFLLYTDQERRKEGLNRQKIDEILSKKGIPNFQYTPFNFYKTLSNSRFVISPEGNGIDCHRTYEALLAGCVPIVEENPLTQEKYQGMPVLYTKDYSDISIPVLEQKWKKMLDTKYDYSKMFISSYPQEIQEEIKKNGNYWLKKLKASLFDFYPDV
jgi:hypothetical protein